MNAKELKEGYEQLNDLAQSEYGQTLEQLVSAPHGPIDPSLQIGRLIGVLLKEPFAESRPLPSPSKLTGAYRAWELRDKQHFQQSSNSWQYRVLTAIAAENQSDAYSIAVDAEHERNFFYYLARSTAKYICGDPTIKKEIAKNVSEMKSKGMNVVVTPPDVAVVTAGLSLGGYLIQHVPILGMAGAPVIAGFVLLLYRIGVDAFCDWAKNGLTGGLEKR
jgi:hypothetical protein